jgi:hypothetical protein
MFESGVKTPKIKNQIQTKIYLCVVYVPIADFGYPV